MRAKQYLVDGHAQDQLLGNKDTPAFVEHAEKLPALVEHTEKLWSVDVTLMDFYV